MASVFPSPPPATPTPEPYGFWHALGLLVMYTILMSIYAKVTKKSLKHFLIEALFFFNVSAEVFVTFLQQFPHDSLKMMLAILCLLSAFAALFALLGDILCFESKKLTMEGRKCSTQGQENVILKFFQDSFNTLKLSEKFRIYVCLLLLVLRALEVMLRAFLSEEKHPFLENDFSVVPLILSFVCWSRRVCRRRKVPSMISVILIGDKVTAHQITIYLQTPSQLFRGMLTLLVQREVSLPTFIEVRGYTVELNEGNVQFNILQRTQHPTDEFELQNWKFPMADFVLIHTDLTAPLTLDVKGWARYADVHAPEIPIILVGTQKAERDANMANGRTDSALQTHDALHLAHSIGALAYCEVDEHLGMQELFRKMLDLAS